MAEEVEITNYGKGGVASEETLSALLRSMEKLAKKEGFDPKDVAKKTKDLSNAMKGGIEIVTKNRDALEKHTDAVEASASALSKTFGFIGFAAGSVANRLTAFATEIAVGGTTLTGFAKELPLVGTLLTPLTQVIDDNVEIYREFSTIGGTAGKSLYDFSKMAAEANMPMNDFRQLVMENSESMKLFGSTTTEGMRNLSALSNEFRKGPGEALFQLGFTSTELNETLVDLAELNSNMFTMGRIRDKITAKSAADLSNTLFDLSAITGKRRDQLKDEMKQAASDYRARVAMASMDKDQRERFRANMTIGGSAMQDALLDMADGIPQSNLAQRLTAMSSVFREKSRDIENMDPREMNNFVVDVRTQLEEFAAANETTIQALAESDAGIRGMLDFTEQSKDLNKLSKEEYAAQLKEKAAMQSREDSILEFQEALNTLRTKLMDALIDSKILETVQKTFETIGKFFGPESTIFTNLFTGLDNLTPSVTQTMESFQAFLEAFAADPKQAINDALSGIGKSLGDTIKDIFLGAKVDVDPRDLEVDMQRQGGLLDGMLKSLAPLGSTIMTSITEGIENIWKDLTLIEKVGVAAAGLFAVGGVIASPLIAGITGLFAAKTVTDAMLNGAKSLFGLDSDIGIDSKGKDNSKKPKSILGNITKHLDDFAKVTKKLPFVGAVITAGIGYFDQDYKDAGYGGLDRMGLKLAEGTLELFDLAQNWTGAGLNYAFGSEFRTDYDLAGAFKDAATSDTWLRSILTFGKPYENTNTPPPTAEDLAIADATSIGITPSIVPPSLPTLPKEPMREDFDSWLLKERKEEQNYKEAMKNYNEEVTKIIAEFQTSLAEYNAKLAENNQASSPNVQQDLNTAMKQIAEIAARQEKYLNKIAKNTGGTPSDVSSAPTNLK